MDAQTIGLAIIALGALIALGAKMLGKFTGLISKALIGLGALGALWSYFMSDGSLLTPGLIVAAAGIGMKFMASGGLLTMRIVGALLMLVGIALAFFNVF